MKTSLFLIFALYGLLSGSLIKIDTNLRHFIDTKDRVNIFHGVNVVFKLPPYLPKNEQFDPMYSLNEKDMEYLKKFGFNFVRFGILWEAIEIAPDTYDYEYLEKIEQMINMLGENGITVLLDVHQDMFSRLFCGEGVPIFYAKHLPYETKCKTNLLSHFFKLVGACIPLETYHWTYVNGVPSVEDCRHNFIKYHQSPELTTIYQSFYENINGIQDKYANFWKIIANKFKNNKYILGYDLWNEPWPGKLWENIFSLWPGHSDHYQVLPFYKKLDQEIRKVNPEYVSFFQSSPFPNTLPLFGGKVVGGFTETPAGTDYLDRQVFNMHSYCCQAGYTVCAKGEPSLDDAMNFCPQFHQHKIAKHVEQSKNLGVPFILTEFGACSTSEACYHEIKNTVAAADDNLVSWAYWNYKSYGDHTTTADFYSEGLFLETGEPQILKLKALTRTYIQAYQGNPLTSKSDDNGDYVSTFIYNPNIKDPSIVYLNEELFYKNGYNLEIFSENEKIDFTQERKENYIHVLISNKNSIKITITIKAK